MFGNSCAVSPLGELAAHSVSRGADVVVAEIDPAAVAATRAQMSYLRDRRPECYRL
jgi:5-aminopentanamidase